MVSGHCCRKPVRLGFVKEDILEQLVDDYLQEKGYFTRHNIKFHPRNDHPDFDSKKDSNHSDIDVIGIHPKKRGHDRVWAVSCKSWQGGFKVDSWLDCIAKNKQVSGRDAWKAFRELISPKWSEAFIDEIEHLTGVRTFTYIQAVTVVNGYRSKWEQHQPFVRAMEGNPIKIVDLSEMLRLIEERSTTTVASSDIGRVLQLMRAAQGGKKALLETVESQ